MSNTKTKPKMTDEERQALIRKMDADLDAFIEERKAAYQPPEGPQVWDKSVDEMVAELKQHPAFMTEVDPTQELSPLMQGLQQLKYESDCNEVNADSYKDDGNHNFKLKKYRWAVENYTKGIQEKCSDRTLNAVLYSNRAAASYHIGNFRSAFRDCIMSRKFKTDHTKAIHRGVNCCLQLKCYSDAIKWCDDALLLDPEDARFLELRNQAVKNKKELERDQRKEAAKERKKQEQQDKLLSTIKGRGIQLADVKPTTEEAGDVLVLSQLESRHPSGAKVHVADDGALCWPVLFVYPEYGQTDLIESYNEHTRFLDHIEAMLGDGVEPAIWDESRKYHPQDIMIYFENKDEERLYDVSSSSTLSEALKHEKYIVYGGTPSFILIVQDSAFSKHFLARYKS